MNPVSEGRTDAMKMICSDYADFRMGMGELGAGRRNIRETNSANLTDFVLWAERLE